MKITHHILHPETRLVVFDLDGTLYSKRGMVWHMLCSAPMAWRRMLAERKTRKHLRGKYLRDEASFYNVYFQIMAQFTSSSPDAMRQWYDHQYMPLMVKVIEQHYTLANWVKPFIAACKKRGIYLVVLSDYGHTAEKLTALGADVAWFDWVGSAPQLGGLKPAPQLMEKIVERFGVSASQCLVIGDRVDTDGALATAVGARFHCAK